MNPHKRTVHCKHFNGIADERPCALGIDLSTLPRLNGYPPCTWGARQPEACGGCDKREFPKDEEIAAEKKKSEELAVRNVVAYAAIVEARDGKRGVAGTIDCPICTTGKLRYSVAESNGHVWGRCSTPECVAWMQ